MRSTICQSTRKSLTLVVVLLFTCAGASLLIANVSNAQQTESRARTTTSVFKNPSPQPTPTASIETGPSRRIAPQLGAPPPPPVLKPKPTPPPDPTTAEINEGDILRISTDLVTLQVRVIDRNNRPINNLRPEDFKILEDGVPQPIFSFSREEVPVIYGMAVDNSGSVRPVLTQILDAARTILNSNKRGDETFLERFVSSDKIEVVQDFTPNRDYLLDGLDNMFIEGGQTAVIDAVYLAATHVAEYKKDADNDRRRRALIVVTDGEDRASYYNENQLFQSLREEDVQIFVIGFVSELDVDRGFIRKSPKQKAMDLLNRMASETGGRVFYPQSVSELPGIANEIVRDLRTQYVISYDPTNKTHDGTFRSIKVSVNQSPEGERRIALTRSGRNAPPEGSVVSRPADSRTTVRPTNTGSQRKP